MDAEEAVEETTEEPEDPTDEQPTDEDDPEAPHTFATVEDLERRWRSLDEYEVERAAAYLEDATLLISAEFRNARREIDDEDEIQAGSLRVVCCSVVKRAMMASTDGDYTQMSMTAGSFNQQWTYANPHGDMYLTANERRILGIPKRRLRIGSIPAFTVGRDADEG